MNYEQALCRALSANEWDETALEALSKRYDGEGYESPDEYIEAVCEEMDIEYDPHSTEPLCSCEGCPWAERCEIKE